uniref:Uncharacterized protein n=1 Tax=Mus spicilegus TaxID=10103 RepID=A0A8C6HYS0_MUSSI
MLQWRRQARAEVKVQVKREVKDFQPYAKGEIWRKRKESYGSERWKMMFMGLICLGVWYNSFWAWIGGVSGHLEGEGCILSFCIRSGNQGILLEHGKKEFGDRVNPLLSSSSGADMSHGGVYKQHHFPCSGSSFR